MPVFVELKEVLEYGVSYDYVRSAMSQNKTGKLKSWDHVKDNDKGVLIDIDTIPDRTRQKYNIPTGKEYMVQKQIDALDNHLREAEFAEKMREEKEMQELYDTYHIDWMQYVPLYRKRFAFNAVTCEEISRAYAKDHAFWVKMVQITGTQYKAFYKKIESGYKMYMALRQKLTFTTNLTSRIHFTNKLRTIREALLIGHEAAVEAIASGQRKPKGKKKTNDFHKAMVLRIMSHPQMYNYRVTADILNHHCMEEGQATVSESWIKQLMVRDGKLRVAVEQYRHGFKHFNDTHLPHAVRIVTPFPGNVWMIDGTPMQFWCWNENRTKQVRLNLFAVIDVCSRKIVGIDISYSEDKFNIMNALKMAVLNEGHLPTEIVSDNFSANKSEEIKDLKLQMENMGIVWRHSKVENPQDKTYIERFFGAFQSVECALYDDYLGEGITSKRKDARPDPKYLESVAKKNGLPTYHEMVQRIVRMVAKYNERERSNRQSPNEVYKNLPKPNIKEMDSFRTALMFWSKTMCTVRRSMVKITVNKIQYAYEIYDNDHKAQLQGKKITVRYDEKDLDTVMLFDDHDQLICECRKAIRINIGAVDRTDEDIQNTYKVEAKKESYIKHITDYGQGLTDRGLKVIGKEDLDIVDPRSLEKNQVNTQESLAFIDRFNILHHLPDEKQKEYAPIATIAQNGVVTDPREKLLQRKEPLRKGSLKVVGTTSGQ
ncbi:DDE-type integrase/transposase/recombinase [Sphingobacterium spiritivorum]|uniref:DDE-type integrase/transposase/recombinase n=1 Tax=Sphingobacterium spiritivorum TaxID=258 RepID=UPI003DA59873